MSERACVCVCVCVFPNYKQGKSPSKHKMTESENLESENKKKKPVTLSCLPALTAQKAEPVEFLTSRTRGSKILVRVRQEYLP